MTTEQPTRVPGPEAGPRTTGAHAAFGARQPLPTTPDTPAPATTTPTPARGDA
ncbi:hypothetical protein [Streptomyces sp. NPDC050534]|uniref:hypothetical protein n=1 Tax=Streptomyces sp. NPDC050534 TaxID=3365625 RepID=UPI003789E1F9